MYFLNTPLFLFFCVMGLYYLFRDAVVLKHPLLPEQKYQVTGPQAFLIFTLGTGMFMTGEYSAVRLFVWIAYLCMGIFMAKGTVKQSFPSRCYILYIVYLFISLFLWSPDIWFGVRVIAKYIFPFFVLLFASKVGKSEFIVLSAIKWILVVALFSGITLEFNLPWRSVLWIRATLADHLVVVEAICIALYFATKKKKYLYLMVCYFSFPVLMTIRTGLVGITACLSVFFLTKYRWKAVPVVLGVVVIAVLTILYVPSVREKMFKKQLSAQEVIENRESLSMKDVQTNGRQAMWDWSLERYYENNKILGSGIGKLQLVFYTEDHPFAPIKIVHNDYVQILCDTGLLGLVLYLLIGVSMAIHTFFIYNDKKNNEIIRLCAIVAGSSIIGIMATSYTDNSVNYALATYCYPFAFYGMTLGLLQKYK